MIYYIIYVDAHETTDPSKSADPFKKTTPKPRPSLGILHQTSKLNEIKEIEIAHHNI